MKRPFLRALLTLAATSVAFPAAAQGTLSPSQTPPQPPEGAVAAPVAPPADPPPVVTAPPASPGDLSTDAPEEKRHQAPPPHTGFQVAARVGAAIPLGDAATDSPLSDTTGAQFSTTVDIGAKIIPQLFLGAYLGANVGGVGSEASKACDLQRATGCLAFTYRIGLEAQFHIIPDGKVDPWIGYGIGYEITRIAGNDNGTTISTTNVGPEYGHVLAGVDFRLTKIFGIGPFVDFSFGKYTNQSSEPSGTSSEISNKAMHEWLTLGAKFLFFP